MVGGSAAAPPSSASQSRKRRKAGSEEGTDGREGWKVGLQRCTKGKGCSSSLIVIGCRGPRDGILGKREGGRSPDLLLIAVYWVLSLYNTEKNEQES